jgi:60kDa lysophospholipase
MNSLVGIDIVVNWNDVLRQTSLRRFRVHKGHSSIYQSERI